MSHSYCKDIILGKAYAIFSVLSLVFFLYAHTDFGKIFYIPCGLTLFCAYLFNREWDNLDILLLLFVGWIFFTDLIHGIIPMCFSDPSIRITFGIACFNGLRKTSEGTLIKYFTAVCVPLVLLSFYIFESPFAADVRYFGFIGDPNYYALTLNLIVFILFQLIAGSNKINWWIVSGVLSIVAIIPIVIAGQSRVGFISLALLLIGGIHVVFKKFRGVSYTVLLLCILSLVCCAIFTEIPHNFADRYAMRGINGWAAMSRFYQIKCMINCINASPGILLCGIGADVNELLLPMYGDCIRTIVHNTFANILFHQGIPGLVIFCLILLKVVKLIFLNKTDLLEKLFFISVLINIMSVSSITYLSFWWSLFYLANKHAIARCTDGN